MKQLLFFYLIIVTNAMFSQEIPEAFLGKWQGNYLVFREAVIDTVAYEFEFTRIGTSNKYNQIGTYKSKKYGDMKKNYRLYFDSTQTNKSHFILDEMNGILIDELFINNGFFANYSLGNEHYATRLTLENGFLTFEIIISNSKNPRISKIKEKKKKYEIKGNRTQTIQTVRMTK